MPLFFIKKHQNNRKIGCLTRIVTYNPLSYNHLLNIFVTGFTMGKNDIQIKLGQRIRKCRNSLGLSQEKFALLIEMDRTYLASVEAGGRNISLKNLEKISKGLNISLSQLFENI